MGGTLQKYLILLTYKNHFNSSEKESAESPSLGDTSHCTKLTITTRVVPSRFATDNFYPYVDGLPDRHFYQGPVLLQMNLNGRHRLTQLIQNEGFSAVCLYLCFPNIYIGWRDTLLNIDCFSEFQCKTITGNNCIALAELRMLLNCLECRNNLEIGKFQKAKEFCKQAEKAVASMSSSWKTGIFYYTKVLIELQESKLQPNRMEFLDRAFYIFSKCCEGFQRDCEFNFTIKYFHLAAQILALCIETDRLFHSTAPGLHRKTNGVANHDTYPVHEITFQENAKHLINKFQEMMKNIQELIDSSESYFQQGSPYWEKTLPSIRECVEKNIKLLRQNPWCRKKKLTDLRKQAMAYISVLIKHPSHEKNQSINNALFPVLTTAMQQQEKTELGGCLQITILEDSNKETELKDNAMGSLSDLRDLDSSGGSSTECCV